MIIQIQISGCSSHCQGLSQVQQATQAAGNLEAVGGSAEQATQLEAPGQATTPAATSTITQVQIGCLTQCFGTTTTSTTPRPVAQQILAELSSLIPPASTSRQPSPGIDQAVIDQISCQVQTGGTAPGTEVQTATQTTLQLIGPSSQDGSSQPTSVDQTEQRTWQLQIGCLFYCTDTQQVQQAQQAITTIQVLIGQPGASSTPGPAGAVGQLIWQLQIGCIAWCYDATEVQDATSQTTVTVITLVPPTSPPPAPPPLSASPAPPARTTDGPPPAPADAAAGTTPSPTTVVSVATAIPVSLSVTRTGVAILGRRPITPAVAAPATARSDVVVSTVSPPAVGSEQLSLHRELVARPGRSYSALPRRDLRAVGGGESLSTASLGAVSARPGSIPSILVVALGLVAATALWAFGTGRHLGRRR